MAPNVDEHETDERVFKDGIVLAVKSTLSLFRSHVDEMSADEVLHYRDQLRNLVDEALGIDVPKSAGRAPIKGL